MGPIFGSCNAACEKSPAQTGGPAHRPGTCFSRKCNWGLNSPELPHKRQKDPVSVLVTVYGTGTWKCLVQVRSPLCSRLRVTPTEVSGDTDTTKRSLELTTTRQLRRKKCDTNHFSCSLYQHVQTLTRVIIAIHRLSFSFLIRNLSTCLNMA